jgi:hypothetical protein
MKRDRKAEIERIIKVERAILKRNEWPDRTKFLKAIDFKKQAYNQILKRGANANYLSALYKAFGISSDYILSGIKAPDLE